MPGQFVGDFKLYLLFNNGSSNSRLRGTNSPKSLIKGPYLGISDILMVDVWSMCQIKNTEKAQEKLNLAEDQFNSISIFYLTITYYH